MSKVREEFFKCASKYSEAMEQVFETDNISKTDRSKHLKIVNQMIGKMKKIHKDAFLSNELSDLEQFMYHDNKYIRCVGATYCLTIKPEIAEDILNKLIDLPVPNYVGPIALLNLDAWKRGFMNPKDY